MPQTQKSRCFTFVLLMFAALSAAPSQAGAQQPDSESPPYEPSPVIESIEWAPPATIIRQAPGGDNWPMTWADDDALYTAYGDGYGFEPLIKTKLSLGLAQITGTPPDFVAVNLRSPTAEQVGQGAEGKKASGMLMVDGVLYMWVRNAGNSQLAWSRDHGRTWQWSDWKFRTSFAAPTFLNFGKNYAGARDDYVYIYSFDSDSAYEPADRMVLARVPRARIRHRDAYEFFAGWTGETRTGEAREGEVREGEAPAEPRWTSDITRRAAVFENPGRCYRSGVTYNAPLQRYLWVQVRPGADRSREEDPRFQGGIAVYDAPQPWGPWTTVFYTKRWDVGPGETASFPTKWISDDGRTVHLVFSGDDHFSVRRGTLKLRGE